MTKRRRLLSIPAVRRGVALSVAAVISVNVLSSFAGGERDKWWQLTMLVTFDSLIWSGLTVVLLEAIDRRGRRPPQSRPQALLTATAALIGIAVILLATRITAESLIFNESYAGLWLNSLPGSFYRALFYTALVVGGGYAVRSWALDDQHTATAARLEAAVARAELKSLAGRLQPEFVMHALDRISTIMRADAARAQRLLADLGALLHDWLDRAPASFVTASEELDAVARYLSFQREVTAAPLQFTITAGPGVRPRQVPAFSLQTLVQQTSAGSMDRRKPARLAITAACDGDGVRLEVREQVEYAGQTATELLAGLQALHEHLRDTYGDRFQFHVAPDTEGATWSVALQVPGVAA
jgi:hypothetical protein